MRRKNEVRIIYFYRLYVECTVVGIGRKKPKFNNELWNVYERVINDLPRSNNSVEAWLEITLSKRYKLCFSDMIE